METRLAPACISQVQVAVLRVDCDNDPTNTVSVENPGSTTTVNGVPFADATFNSVRINIGTGGGLVNLNATPARPVLVQASPQDGGAMNVRVSPVARNLDSIRGTLTVAGGGSRATLELNDQAHPFGTTYSVTTSQIGRPFHTFTYSAVAFLVINGGSGSNTYNVVSSGSGVHLNAGSGTSVVNVETLTAPRGSLNIRGGAGGVAVHLSPNARNLDGIRGNVFIDAGLGGPNTLTVNDQVKVAGVAFRLSAGAVTRQGFGVVINEVMRTITVNGGRGANTYTVEGTGATSQTILNTGAGNATVNVEATTPNLPLTVNGGTGGVAVHLTPTGRNLNLLRGNVTVNGGPGTSRVVYHDFANAVASTYTLSASSLVRPQLPAAVTFLGMTFVTVNGGSAANTYNVTGTGASNVTGLFPGNGNNVVNVEATNLGRRLAVNAGLGDTVVNLTPTARRLDALRGDVDFNAAGGFNALRLHDQANATGVAFTLADFQVRQSQGVIVRFGGQLDELTVHGGNGVNTYSVTTPQVGSTILNTGAANAGVNVEATLLDRRLTVNGGAGGVTVNASPAARTLAALRGDVTVNGTSAGFDALTLNGQADTTFGAIFTVTASVVSGFGFLGVFRFNLLNALTINGGQHTNTFNVFSVAVNTAVTLRAGDLGNDTINVGSTARTLDDIRGPLHVDGQFGFDTLVLDDSGALLPRSYLDDGVGTFQRVPGGPRITYQRVERRVILPGPGFCCGPGPSASVVEVLGNAADTELEIDAGANTIVTVGNDKTGLDDVQGPVTLLGEGDKGNGPVRLHVNDRMTAGGQQYALAQGGITRTGTAPIFYEGIQAVVLDGGGKGNRFDVEGVSPGTPATINTGLGNNLVRMREHEWIRDALEINGEGASDALGYRAYTTDVYVNLQTGTATDVAAFRGIRNLTGGAGNTILVGDGTQESLTGGSGRNLLISGGGSGQLTGGGSGDILIGGITAYDQDPDFLWAILSYWAGSADDYLTRVSNLRQGKGVPQLEAGISVFGGGAANTLTGNGDEAQGVLNLFYVTPAGTITDQQPSEVAVILDGGGAPHGDGGGLSRSWLATRDELSGRPGMAASVPLPAPGVGATRLLLRGARQPASAELTLALELAWCGDWQPFAAPDAGVR